MPWIVAETIIIENDIQNNIKQFARKSKMNDNIIITIAIKSGQKAV